MTRLGAKPPLPPSDYDIAGVDADLFPTCSSYTVDMCAVLCVICAMSWVLHAMLFGTFYLRTAIEWHIPLKKTHKSVSSSCLLMEVSIEENLDTTDKRELGEIRYVQRTPQKFCREVKLFLCWFSGADAIFSISTAKPGNGVEQLRDDRYQNWSDSYFFSLSVKLIRTCFLLCSISWTAETCIKDCYRLWIRNKIMTAINNWSSSASSTWSILAQKHIGNRMGQHHI